MQNVNYGIDADCDTSADIIALLTSDKNHVEICGIINKLLTMLYSSGVKVIDGDNPKDDSWTGSHMTGIRITCIFGQRTYRG